MIHLRVVSSVGRRQVTLCDCRCKRGRRGGGMMREGAAQPKLTSFSLKPLSAFLRVCTPPVSSACNSLSSEGDRSDEESESANSIFKTSVVGTMIQPHLSNKAMKTMPRRLPICMQPPTQSRPLCMPTRCTPSLNAMPRTQMLRSERSLPHR